MHKSKARRILALAATCLLSSQIPSAYAESSNWQDALHQAIAVQKKDSERAVTLYKKAMTEAAAANAPIEKQLGVIYQLGNLLWGNWRADEAKEVYQQGAELAHKNDLKNWEARFLLMTSSATHTAFLLGLTTKNDPAPVFKALELRPVKPGSSTSFYANCLQDIGDAYLDSNDFPNAEKYLIDALEQAQRLPYGTERAGDITRSILLLTIKEKKFADANKLFLRANISDPTNYRENKNYYFDGISRFDPETASVTAKVHQLLDKKDFAGLESYAAELRKIQTQSASGKLPINFFLESTAPASYMPQSKWTKQLETLSQWMKARPDSDTAKIAYAELLAGYAWKARGSGWSNTVTQNGWKLFGERLTQAYTALAQVKNRTPEWYSISQRVALGLGTDKTQYEKIVTECQTTYPKYQVSTFQKSYWLQPKWFGQEGEAEAFIKAEANKLPGTAGDVRYAQIAWFLDFSFANVIKDANFDWARVKRGFAAILKQYPDSLRARAEFSFLAQQMNDKEALASVYPGQGEIDPRMKFNPQGYEEALSRGEEYQKNDNRPLAIHEYSEAIRLAPDNAEAYYLRCEMYVMTNKFAEAQADIDKCLELCPEYVPALAERGRLEVLLEKYPESIADLERALALSPNETSALSELGRNYDALGNHQRALDTANFALETDEQNHAQSLYYGYQDRGWVWSNAHQYDKAADDFRKGIALNPDHSSQLWAFLAYADAATGRVSEAKTDAVKLFHLESFLPRAYRLRAEMHRAAGMWAESIQDYTQSTKAEPTYGPGFWQKAISELATGDYKSAETDLRQSVTLVPTSALAFSYLALAEELQGKSTEANEHIERAFALTANLPINYVNRARVHLHRGELKDAASDCEAALKLDDRNADAYATGAQILKCASKTEESAKFVDAAKAQWWHEWKVPLETIKEPTKEPQADEVSIALPVLSELKPQPFAVSLRDCAP